MSDRPDDFELLRRYAAEKSDEAFARVVGRHADFVYAVALRRTGDVHLAEDVTQATFIVLSRRAGTLSSGSLRAWLHQTTCYAAANALRAKTRRRRVERETPVEATSAPPSRSTQDAWEIRELIDDAVAKLGRGERDVIALHYFEEQTIEQTAGRLGISQDAARKRVSRALEKLRSILARRGVSATLAAIGPALMLPAPHAPPAVLGGAGANAFELARGVIRQMRHAFLRQSAVVAMGVMIVVAAGAGVAQHLSTSQASKPAISAATRPAALGAPLRVKLGDGLTFDLLGVGDSAQPDAAWAPDGTPLPKLPGIMRNYSSASRTPGEMLHIWSHLTFDPSDPPGTLNTRIKQMSMWGGMISDTGDCDTDWVLQSLPQFGIAGIEFGIARGPWKTKRTVDAKGDEHSVDFSFDATVLFTPLSTLDGFVFASVSDTAASSQARLVAFDRAGKDYHPTIGGVGSPSAHTELVRIMSGEFKGLTLDRLDRIEFQVRPYQFVRFDDVSLRRGTITPVRVSMGRLEDGPVLERRMYGKQEWRNGLWSTMQFIAFSSKTEVDVRWDKLAKVGVNRGTDIRATLQDPTYQECFDQIIARVGAARMKMVYVEDQELKVRKFVVSTPEDLAGSAP